MNDRDEPAPAAQRFFKALLTPWRIAAVLLGLLLIGEGYLVWQDRAVEVALENYAPFATPAFELEFFKNFPYDPHLFVGRGARAGLWEWSPEGLTLTEEGRQFFEESGERFISQAAAGRRQIKRIRSSQEVKEGERHVEFLYEWAEVSPPAAALMVPPPREGEEYPGQAVLVREGEAWKVQSLHTRDFEEPLAHLREVASGVLR